MAHLVTWFSFMILLGTSVWCNLGVFHNTTFPFRAQSEGGCYDWNCRQQLLKIFKWIFSSLGNEGQRERSFIWSEANFQGWNQVNCVSHIVCVTSVHRKDTKEHWNIPLEPWEGSIFLFPFFFFFLLFPASCCKFFWTYHWRIEGKLGHFPLAIARNCTQFSFFS